MRTVRAKIGVMRFGSKAPPEIGCYCGIVVCSNKVNKAKAKGAKRFRHEILRNEYRKLVFVGADCTLLVGGGTSAKAK